MRLASLFSGAGGLDLGFIREGFDVIWANDSYEDAVGTYRTNIGDHITFKPIEEIKSSEIPAVDGIIGGFPCQGFSVANTSRHVSDTRNKIYLEFVRIVRDLQPSFFVAENVKGILSLGGGLVFEKVKNDFSDSGYQVAHVLLNAANYGVPQTRERVFLLGIRTDLCGDSSIEFEPIPTHSQKPTLFPPTEPWVSCGLALKDIPEPEHNTELYNHSGSNFKLSFNGYIGHRKVDPDRPAPTITARGDLRGGAVIIHHPNNRRRMTVREVASIQSFPLDYKFVGSNTSAYRQIGNAVPPLLAKHVARAVKKTVTTLHKNSGVR